ncbi:hypothetical protein KAR91_04345, partial [Candidatus Pacearchaeota archaeon]|nr:hypothetical protein [Candidatus Pacearchaeota archaeon]
MKKVLSFENGEIDPRALKFDHHGDVSHRDSFICKMASVQVIEMLISTHQSIANFEIDLNHLGHIDDICLNAIGYAEEQGKIRSLYKFALLCSSVDSMGTIAYQFLENDIQDTIHRVYGIYQSEVDNMIDKLKIERWALEMEQRLECIMEASRQLVAWLDEDDYDPPTIWEPSFTTYKVGELTNGILMVEVIETKFNSLRASQFMFEKYGGDVMLAHRKINGRYKYDICASMLYKTDLSELWGLLAN